MLKNTRSTRNALVLIPCLCALSGALLLTVLRPPHASDLSLGIAAGVIIGISIGAVLLLSNRSRC
jgi:ABC-type Fe3+-siderophore transport system permease subunit